MQTMSSWGHENYQMAMPPMIPPPMMSGMDLMPDMNVQPINSNPALPLIGPIVPEDMVIVTEEMSDANAAVTLNDVSSTQTQKRRSRDRSIRREKERPGSDRRHRSRSRDRHDRYSRSDRNRNIDRNDRSRNNDRERKSKWDNNKGQAIMPQMQPGVMNMGMIPGMNMMHYQNMMPNMMGQQPVDGSMMQQQQMLPNMAMMANMMPNMMDQNMMLMNQQSMMPLPHQQIYLTNGVMLPPNPGAATPQRRDHPKGCRTIFVGGLPFNITQDTLMEMFQKFGVIQDIKSPKSGVFYIRFERPESVESAFFLTGYRFKFHDQVENEATTIFVDYALNREDQSEYERKQRYREKTPPRVEPFSQTALNSIGEKIKSETEFASAAPILAVWLERGECSKKHANAFYSLIQASNNQIRRLFAEKMQIDDDFQTMKNSIKDKFAHVVMQCTSEYSQDPDPEMLDTNSTTITEFERFLSTHLGWKGPGLRYNLHNHAYVDQVAKILSAAKHQRVSDHFTKQQRRNIEMWLKMTEEVENIKEEFNALFDEDESERPAGKNTIALEKYEELKHENENLTYELEGYKNEAYLAKDEAERKFEKFKAHFIAQQALQNKQAFPPLPVLSQFKVESAKPLPPPPTPDDDKVITSGPSVSPSEAKLISILTAFLMVHPLGASVDYLVSYVRSMSPTVTQATIMATLQKFPDIFHCETTGVGACIEHRWLYVTFDKIKNDK